MADEKKQWTLDLIEKLVDAGVGDPPRLSAIKSALEGGRPVFESDKQYLKQKYVELQKKEESQQKVKPTPPQRDSYERDETSKETSEDDDYSLMIIKNRLAKGEISPQEFDILKKKILGTGLAENIQPIKKETKTKRTKLIDPNAKYCAYCDRSVHPERDFSVAALVVLLFLGIIPGLIYYFLKSPACPICKHNQWTIPPNDDED